MNRVTLQATKFTNIPQKTEMFGFRMYDSYGQTYDNSSAETEAEIVDDFELLQLACKSTDKAVLEMLSYLESMKQGIAINGEYYEWADIKHLWADIH